VLSDPPNRPTVSTVALTGDSIELLVSLRQHSHTAEQALYTQLATTPVGALNNVWRAGRGRARWPRCSRC
jgi:hypothetical protein